MCVCVCVCIHTYIHTYMHACIYVSVYTHRHTHTHTHTHIYINAALTLDNQKAPAQDAITALHICPRITSAMYNGCLTSAVFPKRCKRAKLLPIVKPRKAEKNTCRNFPQYVF